MKKLTFFILLLTSYFLLLTSSIPIVHADEWDDLEKLKAEFTRVLKLSIDATTPLEKNLQELQANLEEIRRRIGTIEGNIKIKEQQVKEGEELLVIAEELLSQKVRQIYKYTSSFGSYGLLFLFQQNLGEAFRKFGYQRAVIENDRDAIVKVVLYIKDLEQKKKSLEGEKVRLAKIKKETDEQALFLQKEITGAKKYQAALSRKIAELTSRQQQLLAEKLASLNLPTSLGAGPLYCTDDREIDPGFRPAFAFFTFGIPHRVGMNQYGAYGRAKSGQSYKDILQAYYEGINFEKKDPNMKIKVQGYGEKSLEDYVLRIYEMPESWPIESLKAQAVAARSYALAYTNNGASEICATQACQVYKNDPKGGEWERAVRETAGEVMVSGGEMVKAWYASTFGGYAFTSGDVWGSNRFWTKRMRDTDGEINSFSDLFEKAYDRDSPCFYAAQGWRAEYGKSAWLKVEEVVDIVNVLLLAKEDSNVQKHLAQVDKPNPDGVETWNSDKVKQDLKSRGVAPYNSISEISTDWDKEVGKTTTVHVTGDAGRVSFDGSEFKTFFNLRAPANIQIVGPLYNMERR